MTDMTPPSSRRAASVLRLPWFPALLVLVLGLLQAAPGAAHADDRAASPPIRWLGDDAVAFARARESGRPILVDFWADWCGFCAVMERSTFADPRVKGAIGRFVAVRLDASDGSEAMVNGRFDRAAGRWQVGGLPTVLLFDPRGRLLDRIEGATSPEEFLERLQAAETRCRTNLACR